MTTGRKSPYDLYIFHTLPKYFHAQKEKKTIFLILLFFSPPSVSLSLRTITAFNLFKHFRLRTNFEITCTSNKKKKNKNLPPIARTIETKGKNRIGMESIWPETRFWQHPACGACGKCLVFTDWLPRKYRTLWVRDSLAQVRYVLSIPTDTHTTHVTIMYYVYGSLVIFLLCFVSRCFVWKCYYHITFVEF